MFFKKNNATLGIDLGATYRDKVTGLVGIATAVCAYISGCNQALIAPKADGNKFLDSQWFDVQRLEKLDGEIIALNNGSTPGPDKQAPTR